MFVSILDYGAVEGGADTTSAVQAAWAACQPGDTLDVPPGMWAVQPHAVGYPVLRLGSKDNLSIRLAPGATLALLVGGRDGMLVGDQCRGGTRTGLTIYGGGKLLSWSTSYPVVVWSSAVSPHTLGDMTLRNVEVVGGRDGVYVGARTVGTVLLVGCATAGAYRYAVCAGDAACGLIRLERCHLDRPTIGSSVPHALHVESGAGAGIRIEVVDHCTSDATLSFNGAGGGWLAEDVVLRDGCIMATNATGTVRRAVVSWRRPPNASPRPIFLNGACHGSVIEDVLVDNQWPLDPADARPAVVASTSTGVTLRRVRLMTPNTQPAYSLGSGAVLEDVVVVGVP